MLHHHSRRLRWTPVLLAVAAVLLTLPVSASGRPAAGTAPAGATQSCRLSVFSWWTGGGEAAGLRS